MYFVIFYKTVKIINQGDSDMSFLFIFGFIVFPALTGWYYAGKLNHISSSKYIAMTEYYFEPLKSTSELIFVAVFLEMVHYVSFAILLIATYELILQF